MTISALITAELVLRIVTATELTLTACVLWRAMPGNDLYRSAAALCLCVGGYMLAPLPLHYTPVPQVSYPFVLLANFVPAAFWYFAFTVFADGIRAPRYFVFLLLATAGLGMAGFLTGSRAAFDTLDWLAQLAKLAWLAAAFVIVLRDWRSDLVEPRRRLRRLLLLAAGIYMVAVILVELSISGPAPRILELANVCLIFVLVTGITLHLLAIDPGNTFARLATPAEAPAPIHSPLASRVTEAMTGDRAYATEGLTLDKLAAQVGTRPALLRQVINGELGHRNFNTFVNQYRVEEVASRMAEPMYRNTPLLTLALDAGFRSLAPFNRSFRERFGTTPSAYRSEIKKKSPDLSIG